MADWGNVDTAAWAAKLRAEREKNKAEKEAAKAAKQVAKASSATKVPTVAAPAQATPVANDNTIKKSTTKSSRPTKRGGKELNFSGENVEAKKQKKTPLDEYDKAALQQKAEELEAKRKEKKQIKGHGLLHRKE